MKNSKRMIAVIAASGLALGSLPGVANAQSEGLLDLDLGVNVGDSVELGVNLGLGSLGIPDDVDPGEFPGLAGSLDDLDGAGSGELSSGSDNLGPALGDVVDAASSEGAGSEEGSGEGSSSESNGGGNSGSGELDSGSLGSLIGETETEGDGDFDLVGSLEDIFDAGSSEAEGSSEGSNGEGSGEGSNGGGTENPGSDESDFGSLTDMLGSLSSGPGEGEGTENDTLFGSLEDIFSGSSEGSNGSADETPTDPEPPVGDPDDTPGSGGEIDAGTLLALGSLAGAGIAIGVAVNGGVNLPPLPGVDVAAVCNLPQEGIDFLKNNGSMEQDECLPEEQN